jgi:hypothetical protein
MPSFLTSSPNAPSVVPDSTPVPAGTTPAEADACPQCSAKLIDPNGLGWCRACGYCHSLEQERKSRPLQRPALPAKSSPLCLLECGRLLTRAPTWVWVLLTGVVTVVAGSLPPMLSLAEGSLARCLWCTSQLVLGVLMILVAQAWALMVVADSDDGLGVKDAFISARLWAVTLKRLPETRRQLWLASWGLTAVLSALFLIGGLSYWFTYLPRPAAPPAVESTAPAVEVSP